MLDWNDILRKYISKYSNRIQKTSSPLRTYFNVQYFTYHKIDNHGHYTVLVNRPDWAEHYVANHFYQLDPFLLPADQFSSGIYLADGTHVIPINKLILHEYSTFLNSQPAVMIVERSSAGVEFFGFASPSQLLLLNSVPLLKQFGKHFKQELKDVLCRTDEEPIFLSELKSFPKASNELKSASLSQEMRDGFLSEVGCKKIVEDYSKLSIREKECLNLLLKGKTAKESATILSLSAHSRILLRKRQKQMVLRQ